MLKVGDYVRVKDQEFCSKSKYSWNNKMSEYCNQVFKIKMVMEHYSNWYKLEGCTYGDVNGDGYWNFHEDTLIPLSIEKLKEFLKKERI